MENFAVTSVYISTRLICITDFIFFIVISKIIYLDY